HARWLLQFNRYHKYTVDEHCLRAVVEVTRFRERNDLLGQTYRKLKRKWLLHLVLMLHDLGQGKKRDHSEEGVDIARYIRGRPGLPPRRERAGVSAGVCRGGGECRAARGGLPGQRGGRGCRGAWRADRGQGWSAQRRVLPPSGAWVRPASFPRRRPAPARAA